MSENKLYTKMLNEDYNNDIDFGDFMEICEKLGLPVFEVKILYNPFDEPQRKVTTHKYDSIKEFRKTMPDWSARHYNYRADRAEYYLTYTGIAEGDFVVKGDNSSMMHIWHFQVLEGCVVVHTRDDIID